MTHCRLALLFLTAWMVFPAVFPAWAQAFSEGAPASEGVSHKVEEADSLRKLAETYLGGASLPRLVGRPAALPSLVAVDTLITPQPVEGWAVIESSMTQSGMLSPLDEVAIRLKKDSSVRPGETFLILRNQGKLKHPKTKKLLGHMTWVVGAAQLKSLEGQQGMAQIVRANAEVLRGDILGPMGEAHLRPLLWRKNEKPLEGWVVAVEPVQASMAGGQYLVFIDKGSEDGLWPGNGFYIVRQQDGLSLQTVLNPALQHENAPRQAVGACTLVDVKPHVSACLLTWAVREIVSGDSVVGYLPPP